MLPRTFSKIRCSEVASEAEQTLDALLCKPCRSSHSSYMVCRVVHLPVIFGCLCMHLLSQLTSNFNERRYYSGGVTDGEIVQIISSLFDSCIFRKIL